jgi:hypothetical protein
MHIAGRAYDTGHSGWKQGNIQMAVSEDHASCWVHKDLTVTTKQIQRYIRKIHVKIYDLQYQISFFVLSKIKLHLNVI